LTGLGKSTVGRIKKEMDEDKENMMGGHPAKLSPQDKRAIIHQSTTGPLDNAVQGAQYINSIISNPVHLQTVRKALKESSFRAVVKKKLLRPY
jgi:hypothetical protein